MSCTAYNISYGESRWVASDLPIRYKISNDKFPVNNFDDPIPVVIGNFAEDYLDAGTYIQIQIIDALFSDFSIGDYIQISSDETEEGSLLGVFRVREVTPTSMVIDAGGDLLDNVEWSNANITRYYNNYSVVVDVYTGINDNHPLASERPMTKRARLRATPGEDNTAIVDVSSIVRGDLSRVQNNLCSLDKTDGWANDFNQWTQFYIKFGESYDVINEFGNIELESSDLSDDASPDGTNYYNAVKASNLFQNPQGGSMPAFTISDINYNGSARFMTNFECPTYFSGREFDLSIINDYEDQPTTPNVLRLNEYDSSGTLLAASSYALPDTGIGVYRFDFAHHTFNDSTKRIDAFIEYERDAVDPVVTETLSIKVYSGGAGRCISNASKGGAVYLRWLNHFGGWDSWMFTAYTDRTIDISDKVQITRSVYGSDWDTPFTFGTTETDHISNKSREGRVVRSQSLTDDEATNLGKWLRMSNKVVEIRPLTDGCSGDIQTTVLIDGGKFVYLPGKRRGAREVEIEFTYTDVIISPIQ